MFVFWDFFFNKHHTLDSFTFSLFAYQDWQFAFQLPEAIFHKTATLSQIPRLPKMTILGAVLPGRVAISKYHWMEMLGIHQAHLSRDSLTTAHQPRGLFQTDASTKL